jgi:hypothetical protein
VWRFSASVLTAVALAAGCSVSDPSESKRLADLGEEVLPPESEIVDTDEGSCPQIAGNPSCARVFFVAPGDENERADGLEEAARAAGWEVVLREPRQGGLFVELGREGYRAFAALWEEEVAAPCRAEPSTSCSDEVQVIEDL